ncbi:MAG TPA: phenylalanine--tRNA ligase subunit beta, partial [Longimicrobiales bacterium]|nr:phenylalanine--tRNA ligase subunit beta [Longimicrobiales bacterium]
TIREAEIRGAESLGMLCSERELGLGRDHSGLLELDGDVEPGASFVEAFGLDDVRFDVEVTPNRGDLLSHRGIARELAPEGDAGLRLPPIPGGPELEPSLIEHAREVTAGGATIRIEEPDLCFRYLGAVIRGVRVGPSPAWLASRLRAAGARPINNVVDATNYVLLEMGQPLHAFDLERLRDHTIVVRRARPGEVITTLDGVDRSLSAEMLCICDARDPVAVAGVMGGEDSEVSGETTDVLLECALFEPTQVRATRQALDLSTDASYRFERGVDPTLMASALRRAAEVILATAGGELEEEVADVRPRPWEGLHVPLRPARVRRLLGVGFEADELRGLLEPLGFGVEEGTEEALSGRIPGWRSYDVTREVDLIEEVARSHGYDRFPEELGPFRPGTVPDDPFFRLEDELRDHLVGRGYLEAQLPAFAPPDEGEVALLNPISADESHLRASLVPGLLRRVEHNLARGVRDVRLFEIGTCFFSGPDGPRPREETRVAVVVTGRRRPPHWSRPDEPVDLWDVKALLAELVERARIPEGAVTPGAPDGAPVEESRGFAVRDGDGEVVGSGGRLPPGAVDAPPWAGDVWALEVILPAEPGPAPVPAFEAPQAFPGVERDLALLVPREVPVERVREAIVGAGGGFLGAVEIFDLYEGEGIPPGTRSVAYRLHFASPERTLMDEDVDEATARVVRTLEEELGVERRGG